MRFLQGVTRLMVLLNNYFLHIIRKSRLLADMNFLLPKTYISMKKILKNYWRRGLPLQNFGGLAPLL